MLITVITPTYNRAYTLKRCYDSLKIQTNKNFEWIIVDDGSTDNTRILIESFITENIMPIDDIYQKNGGKHRALNSGIDFANGSLVVCLDSDDALSFDAIENVSNIWISHKQSNYIGILAKRGTFDSKKALCTSWPEDLKYSKLSELQNKYNFSGDTVLFYKKELLIKHKFKEFDNENFLPEDSLYFELENEGNLLLLDKILYYCDYLNDGLTKKFLNLLYNNPMGTSYTYYIKSKASKNLIDKIHNSIISDAYLYLSKKKIQYERQWSFDMLISKLLYKIYIYYKIKF